MRVQWTDPLEMGSNTLALDITGAVPLLYLILEKE